MHKKATKKGNYDKGYETKKKVAVIDAMADGLGPHNYSMNDYALIGYANPFV